MDAEMHKVDDYGKDVSVAYRQAARSMQADNFAELGVEKYEIVAALDSTTCETCAAMDGKQFPLKEEAAGINASPFHARCRCCKAPVVEDEAPGERAVRGEDGKIYYVPENMTYDEWKARHVDEKSAETSSQSDAPCAILESNSHLRSEPNVKAVSLLTRSRLLKLSRRFCQHRLGRLSTRYWALHRRL